MILLHNSYLCCISQGTVMFSLTIEFLNLFLHSETETLEKMENYLENADSKSHTVVLNVILRNAQ